jgi:hypothetical protein
MHTQYNSLFGFKDNIAAWLDPQMPQYTNELTADDPLKFGLNVYQNITRKLNEKNPDARTYYQNRKDVNCQLGRIGWAIVQLDSLVSGGDGREGFLNLTKEIIEKSIIDINSRASIDAREKLRTEEKDFWSTLDQSMYHMHDLERLSHADTIAKFDELKEDRNSIRQRTYYKPHISNGIMSDLTIIRAQEKDTYALKNIVSC